MRAYLYLNEKKPENLVATVDMVEVVPRGIYQVGSKVYQYTAQPKFLISAPHPMDPYHKCELIGVELVVEEYEEPKTRGV